MEAKYYKTSKSLIKVVKESPTIFSISKFKIVDVAKNEITYFEYKTISFDDHGITEISEDIWNKVKIPYETYINAFKETIEKNITL